MIRILIIIFLLFGSWQFLKILRKEDWVLLGCIERRLMYQQNMNPLEIKSKSKANSQTCYCITDIISFWEIPIKLDFL